MSHLAGFEHVYIDKQSPDTLLLLHGTGGGERDLLPLGQSLDPKANLLSPRGRVQEDGQARFFKRLAEGVFDRDDLAERARELEIFIKEAAGRYGFAPDRLSAVGFSNGANIALYLIATRPEAVRRAFLFRPMAAALPDKTADLHGVRLLILVGLFDPLIPPEDADRLEKVLAGQGAEVALKKFPTGHGLTGEDIISAREWIYSL